MSTSREQERTAECQRLVEELNSFQDELSDWETEFIRSFEEQFLEYGEKTFVSDTRYDKLTEIYRRVIG